ncbi:hypothetical protein ACFQKF_12780 [Halalkalicoccus sp. GCM10025322]|uniref:hypothetical protein n=1 Tax=Halalkalicoccus TaxID=332246 RepID=UPI002F969B1B
MSAKQHHSQVGPERGDNTHPDTADRMENSVPATIEIDLGIDPVAYQYESWSEMADEWVTSLRSTAETMPNPNHDQIRNVTPLVPLSDVEALVERMVLSGEVDLASDRINATEGTSPS